MSARDSQADTDALAVDAPLHGVLAEFDRPQALMAAARKVRDAGYRDWDTFTPFPVHGMEKAMGIKMTILPWLTFCGGITGLITAIVMQWWMNAVDYPWVISGKPIWSIPANIPVAFEMTVLFSVFAHGLSARRLADRYASAVAHVSHTPPGGEAPVPLPVRGLLHRRPAAATTRGAGDDR